MRAWINKSLMVAVTLTVVALATAAMAEVANSYAGQVILFDKRPPSSWANDGVFHRFVSQHKIGGINEDAEGNWRVEYMAFFRRPVDDREVTVRFYDAQDNSGRYLTSYTLYLNDLSQRIVGGSVKLERPDFRPNHYYKVTVASKGRTIASLSKFALIGQEPERTGEVDFTQDE